MTLDPYDLAERVGPKLGELVHPGDDDVPPFPLSLPTFQPSVLPEGMADAEAEELGLPTANLNKLFLEALFALLGREYGVALVDAHELADLTTAARAREHKRHEKKNLYCNCGTKLAALMVQDFDTDNPRVNGSALIKAMAAMNPDCETGHKA